MNFTRVRAIGDARLKAKIEHDISFVKLLKPEDWEETISMLRNLRWKFIGARPEGEHVVAVYRHRCSAYYGGTVETQSEFYISTRLIDEP